jgi:hypothetical protein
MSYPVSLTMDSGSSRVNQSVVTSAVSTWVFSLGMNFPAYLLLLPRVEKGIICPSRRLMHLIFVPFLKQRLDQSLLWYQSAFGLAVFHSDSDSADCHTDQWLVTVE